MTRGALAATTCLQIECESGLWCELAQGSGRPCAPMKNCRSSVTSEISAIGAASRRQVSCASRSNACGLSSRSVARSASGPPAAAWQRSTDLKARLPQADSRLLLHHDKSLGGKEIPSLLPMIDAPPCRALTSSWTLRAAPAALLAATLLLGAQAGVRGAPRHQRQHVQSRPARRVGSRDRRLSGRASRDRRQLQCLRPRKLQEIDPQLADQRLTRRRLLVRRQSHEAVRGSRSARGRERPVHARGQAADDGGRARSRHGRRPAVRRSLHLLPYRRVLPA